METSSDSQREEHENEMIIIVRQSLVDDSANVRAAAAVAFDVLQETLGTKAIDETIPTLLEALRQPGESSGTALQALREVMNVRASTVFPVLIPTLIATPVTAFNARALASLVTVAGNALSKRLTTILTALIRAIENERDEELKYEINEAVRALLGSISDAEGLQTLMLLLAGWYAFDWRDISFRLTTFQGEERIVDTASQRARLFWHILRGHDTRLLDLPPRLGSIHCLSNGRPPVRSSGRCSASPQPVRQIS